MNLTTICFALVLASASAQTAPPAEELKRVVFERTRARLQGDSETYQRYTAGTFLWTGTDGRSWIRTNKIRERTPREDVFFDLQDIQVLVVGNITDISYRLVEYESSEEGAAYFKTQRTE